MTRYTLLNAVFIAIIFTSCGQSNNQNPSEVKEQDTFVNRARDEQVIPIDYKSDSYKMLLGEDYRVSGKIIDWQWAALEDDDNKMDSVRNDAFIYLGEPSINYNGEDCLPALHIQTRRSIIGSFICSILFNLEEQPNAVEAFLNLISKDFKKLQNESVKKAIITKGVFEFETMFYIETYKLTKGKQLEYDKFEYTIELKKSHCG